MPAGSRPRDFFTAFLICSSEALGGKKEKNRGEVEKKREPRNRLGRISESSLSILFVQAPSIPKERREHEERRRPRHRFDECLFAQAPGLERKKKKKGRDKKRGEEGEKEGERTAIRRMSLDEDQPYLRYPGRTRKRKGEGKKKKGGGGEGAIVPALYRQINS